MSEVSTQCEECGYELRGLSPGSACPECGQTPGETSPTSRWDIQWRRTVAIGLALLVFVTLRGTAGVLIQPFSYDIGGTLPSLNVPGPKLWVAPLLQRPIGRSPEVPGVMGVQAALLSLAAIWLLTVKRPIYLDERAPFETLRIVTRWTCIGLFGCAFGLTLGAAEIWPDDLPPYRLYIVAGAELPSASLLYIYLRALAERIPGRGRRITLDHLRWMVPGIIFIGAVFIATTWLMTPSQRHDLSRPLIWTATAVYGAIATGVGVVATVTVGGLALEFASSGFPNAWRVISGWRRSIAATWRWIRDAESRRLRGAALCIGLGLLVYCMVYGSYSLISMPTRKGLAGELPFVGFAGPKIRINATIGGSYSWWGSVGLTTTILYQLTAVWLTTIAVTPAMRGWVSRHALRWSSALVFGATLGIYFGWSNVKELLGRIDEDGARYSEFYFAVSALCEFPLALLLYSYLRKVCNATAAPRHLRRQILALMAVMVLLLAGSFAGFAFSRAYQSRGSEPIVIAICGLYGAIAITTAVWATTIIVSLAWHILQHEVIRRRPDANA